jgi:hypothetical protein
VPRWFCGSRCPSRPGSVSPIGTVTRAPDSAAPASRTSAVRGRPSECRSQLSPIRGTHGFRGAVAVRDLRHAAGAEALTDAGAMHALEGHHLHRQSDDDQLGAH